MGSTVLGIAPFNLPDSPASTMSTSSSMYGHGPNYRYRRDFMILPQARSMNLLRPCHYAIPPMAIEYTIGGEELHKLAERNVKLVRLWLDGTTRFRIDRSAYDLGPDRQPPMQLRVPQLGSDRFERFDLVGQTLDEAGNPQRMVYVECKDYSSDGNQGKLYDEYLAVCYSALVSMSQGMGGLPDIEFMWATTHPFAQSEYTKLTSVARIQRGCEAHPKRLAGETYDESIAKQLTERLWLSIINPRVEEMMPGTKIRQAVAAQYISMTIA